MNKLNRRKFLIGLALSTAFGPIASGANALRSNLAVKGNKLFDQGKEVRLRGVVLSDILKKKAGNNEYRELPNYEMLARSWKANVVRMSLYPGYWKADKENSMARTLEQVRAARRANLYVIICWHAIGFPGGLVRRPQGRWGSRPDAYESSISDLHEFWKWASSTFHDDQGILFELWNEPVYDTEDHKNAPKRWTQLKHLWEEVIAKDIRPLAKNIVICSTDHAAYDLRGVREDPVLDANTGYAWHVYPGKVYGDINRCLKYLDGLDKSKVVFVTEWGFIPSVDKPDDRFSRFYASKSAFGDKLIDGILEPKGIHWTAFNYGKYSQPAMLEPDGSSLSSWGGYVKNKIEKLNGFESR